MRIKKIIACAVFVGVLTLSAAAASADGTIGIYDYAPGGALTSDSGEKFAVNGGFNISFYSDEDTDAVMTVSAAAFGGGRYGLLFVNETEPGKVYFEDAPSVALAAGGGAFKLKDSTKTAPYSIEKSDFDDYTFNVSLKKGMNTVYAPPYDLTDQCGNFVYVKDGVKLNRGVCFNSISVKSKASKTIYVCDIDKSNLPYHASYSPNGNVVPGLNAADPKDGHSYFQAYESMYTLVPFEVSTEGDYVVNVRYSAFASDNMTKTAPAAVYLDANTEGIKNDDWTQFLSSSVTAEQRREFTDRKLNSITDGGSIKPIDLGQWKTCFSVNGDAKEFPYYDIKSFKLTGLKPGKHSLLFYTAKGILDSGSDEAVNQKVLFNSFEIRRITDESRALDIFYTYVSTKSDWASYKFYASVPQDSVERDKPLSAVITVANNREEELVCDLRFAYYYADGQLAEVRSIPIHLKPYESFEKMTVLVHNKDASTLRVFLMDSETLQPYITTVKTLALH